MIVPNKITSLDDSILGKIRLLLIEDIEEITIQDLLKLKLKKFTDIGEFVLALDTLYALGKVELDEEKGILRYVN